MRSVSASLNSSPRSRERDRIRRIALLAAPILLALGLGGYLAAREPLARLPHRKNIIFILIDTLRADHLGAYGYERKTSPRIDAIARQGVLFTRFYSVSSWTNTTIASLFTGRYPRALFPPSHFSEAIQRYIPQNVETLAEVMKSQGYFTAALMEHPFLTQSRFGRGFDSYQMVRPAGLPRADLPPHQIQRNRTLRRLPPLLERERPFFIYIHLMYPHFPYEPQPPYDSMFGAAYTAMLPEQKERAINMYDGEIRYTDELVGAIWDLLAARGLLDESYLVITSDHGEEFWEHGQFDHGKTLYNEVLHVPLIVKLPGEQRAQRRIEGRFSNINLFPTLVEISGAPARPGLAGRSLSACFSASCEPFADEIRSESPHSYKIMAQAILKGGLKYIYTPESAIKDEIFSLPEDPGEQRNLLLERSYDIRELRESAARHADETEKQRRRNSEARTAPSPQELEQLKSLGYLN